MNIFITGIAGFLGSNLAHYLSNKGFKVYGNDNFIGGYEDNLSKNFKFYNVDCCDFNKMNKILKNMDIVIHSAATAYEGFSVFSPSFVTKNIYEASVSTFSAAISNKVKKIIFFSSMARYGEQSYPFTEDMTPMPQDPYGIAKVAAEQTLKNLCNTHKTDWTILVPHNIVGPRQKYDDPFRNVLSIFLNRMIRKKPAIIYGDGSQKRCFSYVDDCISCIEESITNEITSKEIINIGPDEEFISIKELADKCSNITGFNEKHIYYKDRPQEVKFATCSSNKARKLINYRTKYTLEESIKLTYEYIKARGAKEFEYKFDLEIQNDLTPETWKNKII
tara:strand:+ start:1167 stop:2168 length:1002 start_codon:yes stop_codon:yes gene_type:complete